MVICPQCGYPYESEAVTISVRDVTCANCAWGGLSSELITAPEEAPVAEMQALYKWLGEELAPVLGKKMVELGLLQPSHEKANVVKIARVLKGGTRGAFQGVISTLFIEEAGDAGPN